MKNFKVKLVRKDANPFHPNYRRTAYDVATVKIQANSEEEVRKYWDEAKSMERFKDYDLRDVEELES